MNTNIPNELKDAGFPGMVDSWRDPQNNTMSTGPVEGWEHFWHMPSLSELITACGNKFTILGRVFNADNGFETTGWVAHTHDGGAVDGSTPEEAVARLWLALNLPPKENN